MEAIAYRQTTGEPNSSVGCCCRSDLETKTGTHVRILLNHRVFTQARSVADIRLLLHCHPMKRSIITNVAALVFLACGTVAAAEPMTVPTIGNATMREDGTIVLDLDNDGDGRPIHAKVTYEVNDPNYGKVLCHLGDIARGQRKPFKPWSNGSEC